MGQDPADTAKVIAVRNQFGADVPVLVARDQADEDIIAAAMQQGARDVVTLRNPVRLQAVVTRELEAYRQKKALQNTISSAREYREQLKSFMAGSADAIAYVQEGIVVDVNPAWLSLYGIDSAEAVVGTPLMDSFEPDAHATIKGALVACLQGRWSDHVQRAGARLGDGSTAPLEIELSRADFEGEPAVRLRVPSQKREAGNLTEQLSDALERDAATGALQRRCFVDRLRKSLAQPVRAGVRLLVSIEPDKMEALCEAIGTLAVEDFIGQFAGLAGETRQPNDLLGRFGEGRFLLLMERGTVRDVQTWAANLVRKVSSQVFRAGDKQISCTCSAGIAMVDPRSPDAARSITDAIDAQLSARQAGGGRVSMVDRLDQDTKQQAADEIWAQHIRAALNDSRFRLLQQPIASLLGEDRGMFDVLVRMVDEQGQELLPAEFMAAAKRNDLMKDIDRWVIGSAMAFCASGPVNLLFIRLSRGSIRDRSLLPWLVDQAKGARVEPRRIALQISEQVATEYLADTTELASGLRSNGFLCAVEHFGTGRDPARLLAHLPVDYVKVDGTLMQGLAVDQNLEESTDARNHLARAVGVADDALDGIHRFALVFRFRREPAQGRLSVGNYGGKRLVYFVGTRGGQLAHRRHPGHARELELRFRQRLLRLLALGDVVDDLDEHRRHVLRARYQRHARIRPQQTTVLRKVASLHVVVAAALGHELGDAGLNRAAVRLRRDLIQRQAAQLRLLVPEQARQGGIDRAAETLPLTGTGVSGVCFLDQYGTLYARARFDAAGEETMDAFIDGPGSGGVVGGPSLAPLTPLGYDGAYGASIGGLTAIATSKDATATITIGGQATRTPTPTCKFLWQAVEAPN